MKTPKFALLRWMMAMLLVLVSLGNNFVFYVGSVSAEYDEGGDTSIVSEDIVEESDAQEDESDGADASFSEEESVDVDEEFVDEDDDVIVVVDSEEEELSEESTTSFGLQGGEMNLLSQGVLQNFSWTGTDLTPGATGVTYVFSYTTQTEVPVHHTIFRYFFSGNGWISPSNVASDFVTVTVNGSPATHSPGSWAGGNSFWIRLNAMVPAGSDIVVTISNMTNHHRPVVSPTTTVVTQNSSGFPTYDVAPSDAQPIILPPKTFEELIDRCLINSGSINIPYQECVGLAHLYIETDGQMTWRNNTNWFVDADVTTWRTASCNEPSDYYQGDYNGFCNGYPFVSEYIDWSRYSYAIALTGSGPIKNIYAINLSDNNLQGSISSGLLYFPHLTYLDMSDNDLVSVNLSANNQLQYLSLGDNDDNNPWTLDLSHNPLLEYVALDDLGLESLILDHQYLYYLDVDGNNFTSLDVSNLPALVYLDAEDNYNMTSITGFNGKQYLEYLRFEDSAVSGHVHFADMPALRTIRAEDNQITSVSFVNLPALEYLNMEGNMLASIDLSNLSSLQTVELYDNQLTSVTLSNLPSLSYLYLAANLLTDDGFDFVPANQQMQDVYLSNNKFVSFPASLLSLDSLNGFDISNNCIDVANFDSAVLAWLDYNVNWYYVNNQQYCVYIDLDDTVQGYATLHQQNGWLGGGDWGASYDMDVIRNGFLGDFIGLPGHAFSEIVYTWDNPVNVSSVVVYWQAGPFSRDPDAYYFSYRDDNTDQWISPSAWQADAAYQAFRTRYVFELPSSVMTTKVRLVRPSIGGEGGVGLSQFLVYGPSQQQVVVPPSSGCSGCGGGRSILLSHGSAMTIPQTIASRLLSNYWNGQSMFQIQENISRLIYLNKQIQAKESVSVDMKELFVAVVYELIQRFAVMKSGR